MQCCSIFFDPNTKLLNNIFKSFIKGFFARKSIFGLPTSLLELILEQKGTDDFVKIVSLNIFSSKLSSFFQQKMNIFIKNKLF
jgi:hypothetical protein